MKKLTNLLVASAVVLGSAAAVAESHRNFTGFYVGGNAGYGFGSGELKDAAASVDYGFKGFSGGVHAGYGKVFQNKLYVGMELNAALSGLKAKDGTSEAKRKDAFGAAARVGGLLNTFLVYVKLGAESAKFESKAATLKKTGRVLGWVAGLGAETMVAEHVMVGGEWTYTTYRNVKAPVNAAGVNLYNSLKPKVGDFKLRLSYKF